MLFNKELPWITEAKTVFGLHEVRDKAALQKYLKSDGKTLGDPSKLPWCFAGDVEILTKDGWQRFDSLKAAQVAQVDENYQVTYSEYTPISKPYNDRAYKISNKFLDVICDINHKWYGCWGTTGRIKVNKPDSFGTLDKLNTQGLTIKPLNSGMPGLNISEDKLHILAAFISDGFFHRNKLEFQVSKQRKLESLRSLKPKHEYTAPRTYGDLTKTPLTTFTFDIPEWFSGIFDAYKQLSMSFITSLSKQELIMFLDYYATYDGSVRDDGRITLYTSDEYIRDMLITIVSLSGFFPNIEAGGNSSLTNKPSWRIGFSKKTLNRRIMPEQVSEVPYEGIMYCVTVPTSRIVIRGKNLIPVVTGNCGDLVETVIKKSLPKEPFPGALGENPYWAKNWALFGKEVKPCYGCVLVFGREGGGHVGFAVGENEADYFVLGGNQGNTVSIARIDKKRLLNARWPTTYEKGTIPLPKLSAKDIPKTTNEF